MESPERRVSRLRCRITLIKILIMQMISEHSHMNRVSKVRAEANFVLGEGQAGSIQYEFTNLLIKTFLNTFKSIKILCSLFKLSRGFPNVFFSNLAYF